ncbi:unnamed protein product [Orchesella dallaii]|uniref:Farnesoate epoxidase n=1 Tax=Orchesella dallaii TaxID=48710 RepID=A0ABP1RJ10_9HEXA
MIVEFCLVLLTFLLLLYKSLRKRGKLPSGPPPLPFIGNIHQLLGKDVHLKFSKWVEEYGKLYTVQFGTKRALVISDPKLIKELFINPASTGRFVMEVFLVLGRGRYGIVNTDGSHWTEQKNFSARTLKSFGLSGIGKIVLEQQILRDIQEFLDKIRVETQSLCIFDLTKRLNCNVMWKVIASGGNKKGSETEIVHYNHVAELTEDYLNSMGKGTETGLAFLPWLKYIAPELSGYNHLKSAADKVYDLVAHHINERRKVFVKGDVKDVMDAYVEKLELCDDPKSTFYGKNGLRNSISSTLELVTASGDTTPHTINWIMLYLAHHQNVQQKLCEEIDRVIGSDRSPSLVDRKNMPYYEAVLQEILRLSSLGWMGIPHQLLNDVEFEGYTLPKGLIILPNLFYVHHDPETWGDPENFRPERFINEKGSFVRHECMMPFGVGKRLCYGESIARDIIFLFIVRFFQVAQVFPESLETKPDFKAKFGFLLTAKPFKVNLKWRGKMVSS